MAAPLIFEASKFERQFQSLPGSLSEKSYPLLSLPGSRPRWPQFHSLQVPLSVYQEETRPIRESLQTRALNEEVPFLSTPKVTPDRRAAGRGWKRAPALLQKGVAPSLFEKSHCPRP